MNGVRSGRGVAGCRWLSVVYMALAQLGVPRPALDAADGWAWAGAPAALEAHATADFVTATLRSRAASAEQSLAATVDSPVSAQCCALLAESGACGSRAVSMVG